MRGLEINDKGRGHIYIKGHCDSMTDPAQREGRVCGNFVVVFLIKKNGTLLRITLTD